ncbi:uncharacterized protein FA14DRAFT_78578 [Meira miltonrushii]|uniref:LIM zinc-binding domain-containing protein n=1 Tax=Meira miltonrushii TaxID=1280837 RepID=A0A316V5L3_9BASI|nr:uncharacterized protein FA14DRAFT_78578 [Meira miltonrushii]PWN32840.1 hypothetical protein FA14DRAFT_78578 [Meira miltonrushii]
MAYQYHHQQYFSGNSFNNYINGYSMFEPSYQHIHSPYDYNQAAHNAIDVGEGDEGPGMAGVGARRLAQRMAAKKAAQERRWQAEQDSQISGPDPIQKEYENSIRATEYQQQRQQNQHDYSSADFGHQSYESQGRSQWQDHQQHDNHSHMQQRSSDEEIRMGGGSRNANTASRSYSSDEYANRSQEQLSFRRQNTDSQSTARPQDYKKQEEPNQMISDGFGGLMLQVNEVRGPMQQRASTATNARATVYEDDYEESEHFRSTDDTAFRRQSEAAVESPADLTVPLSGDAKGMVARETILEPLPKASCADCGDRIPFEELVQHECVKNACRSPLLQKGAGSISSRSCSPMPDQGAPLSTSNLSTRSPFFDRYEKAQDEVVNRNFLSSALTASTISASPSPLLKTKKLPSDTSCSPRSNLSPLVGSHDEEEDRQRSERKKQIEAQRAAKKQALIDRAAAKLTAEARAKNISPIEQFSQNRSHRRGAESESSTVSTTSTKSTASSLFVKHIPETLTPSSSNEMVSSTKSNSPSKKEINLDDIEGLMNDITNGSSPKSKSKKRSVKEKHSHQQHSGRVPHHVRQPSETSLKQRNLAVTRASELVLKAQDDVSPIKIARPTVSRTRTTDTREHKLCSVCLATFKKGQPIVERDGKLFCVDDYAELYLEKCRKCKQAIKTVGVRSKDGALTGLFHRECFSCLQCDATFDDGTFYVFENAAYCSQHYHMLNGTTCQGCNSGIEGQCRQLTETGERFHQHCFTCQFDNGKEFCKDLLHDYFVYEGKRLCEWHFEKVLRSVKRRERRGKKEEQQSDAIAAAEIRAARRTTMLQTVAAKKGRA